MPGKQDMPSTIRRSEKHAEDIYVKTHDHAVEEYGEGEKAHRTALASLKHEYRKSGDRWVPKGHTGPSDDRAASRDNTGKTAGGYDVGPRATLKELRQEARELDIHGRSRMSKDQLKQAITKKAA